MIKRNFACLVLLLFFYCIQPLPAAATHRDIARSKIVDLTHPFDSKTIYWPTSPNHFDMKKISQGKTESGYFYSAFSFCTPEHGGTHMDAPYHFSKNGLTVDKVPVSQLIGNAIVIDIRLKAEKDRDYRLALTDIQEWEKRYGIIPSDTIVLLRTGWDKRWSNAKDYLGDEKDINKLHFPSFSEESAKYLIKNRKAKAIGVDTASIDYGQSKDFLVHRLIGEENIPGFENLAFLEELPPKGSVMIALPMKISGGSGAPLRAVALLD